MTSLNALAIVGGLSVVAVILHRWDTRRTAEKLSRMTPEERERYHEEMFEDRQW